MTSRRHTHTRRVDSHRPPQLSPHRGPRTSTRPPQNRTHRTRNAAHRAPLPITVQAPASAALDPTTPWPAPLLTQLVEALTEPDATVVLMPALDPHGTAFDGAGAAVEERVCERGRVVTTIWPDPPSTPIKDRVPDGAPNGQTTPAESDEPALPAPADDHSTPASPGADLVVTHLPPEAGEGAGVEQLATAAAGQLAPGGVFAVLTHSDQVGGVLRDPSGRVVEAGQQAGLRYLQHLVLLLTPIHQGQLMPADQAAAEPAMTSARHVRTHADALLLARPADES